MSEDTRKEIDFSMFLLYRLAKTWKKPVAYVYATLTKAHAIDEYIIPFYDVLHTLGEDYLVEDVTEYVRKRGVVV